MSFQEAVDTLNWAKVALSGDPNHHDVLEAQAALNTALPVLEKIKDQGCLTGGHNFQGSECTVCGADAYDFTATVGSTP